MGGWWRWALVSPDGVAPSQMVSMSASVNLPLHHKVEKFSSGTAHPGGPGKRAVKRLWCGGCSSQCQTNSVWALKAIYCWVTYGTSCVVLIVGGIRCRLQLNSATAFTHLLPAMKTGLETYEHDSIPPEHALPTVDSLWFLPAPACNMCQMIHRGRCHTEFTVLVALTFTFGAGIYQQILGPVTVKKFDWLIERLHRRLFG